MDFTAFASLYIAWARGRLKSHRRTEQVLGKWAEFFAGRSVESIRRVDVAQFIAIRQQAGRSAATINADLVALSSAFRYAIRVLEWDIRNPVTGQFLRAPEGRLRYLSPAEAARLLPAASEARSPRILPFVILALNTGCRKSELAQLRWSEVDLDARRITLDGKRTKSGRRRLLPLNQAALDALEARRRWCDAHCPDTAWVFCTRGGRLVKDMRRAVKAALGRAGIADFRVHDLRHTFASWLVQRDVPLTHVRDLLGHSTVKMTERYAHLASDTLARAVAVLDAR